MIPIADSEKSRRFPFLNLIFIAITIYVFFLQLTTPDPEAFIYTYALIPTNVDFSNIATLYPFITSMFLHGGFLHIASNMIFLWVFGDNVEGHLPPFLYLFLYIGAGIVGSLTQYFINPTSTIPMLGASGAVAGILGAYFTLFPHHKIETLIIIPPFITTTTMSASFMLGYWIILQVVSGISTFGLSMGEQGGIAYFAHIGGFVFGYVFAQLFSKQEI